MTDDPGRPLQRWQMPIRAALRAARLAKVRAYYRGEWSNGDDFAIGADAVFSTLGPVKFGNRVHIARALHVETSLFVGDDVLISSRVAFIGNDHDFADPKHTVFAGRRLPQATVVVEGDNLIGFGATVIGDRRIGQGAIVAARSVVTKDVPPGVVVGGVPARVIRDREGQ